MKKIIATLSLLIVIGVGTSAYILKNSNGIAGQTGSPGETSCNSCHSGGQSAASGISITAIPSFTNDEYVPGTSYTISVTASAAGFTRYGFGCEILDAGNANAGVISLNGTGTGVQLLTFAGKRNAAHTTPKTGSTATFTFKWLAPAPGSGDATIYAAANAVNGNSSTSGDFPIAPVSMPLAEAAPTVTTGISQHSKIISQVSVYPNPAIGISNMSYYLSEAQLMRVELVDISGKPVKLLLNEQQAPGVHSQLLDLQNVAAGVYFVKTLANNRQVSQKLITIQ